MPHMYTQERPLSYPKQFWNINKGIIDTKEKKSEIRMHELLRDVASGETDCYNQIRNMKL
ncbi:hypothetical protein St703_29580 [Sporolactobacillus terrae]|nr:hypothetical protein St703_29580 [Sporolactobacillus terrae]